MTLDEEAMFLEALEKTSAEARSKYLDEACAGDPGRRREIERLLEAHAQADEFLAGRRDAEEFMGKKNRDWQDGLRAVLNLRRKTKSGR